MSEPGVGAGAGAEKKKAQGSGKKRDRKPGAASRGNGSITAQPIAGEMNSEQLPAEAKELFERNMGFFKELLPQTHDIISKVQPKGRLVWLEDGDVNLHDGNSLLFTGGAKKHTERAIQQYEKNPSRIVFAKPDLMFERDSASNPPEDGEYEFATQRYDDRNTDDHTDRFGARANSVLREHNVNVTDTIRRNKPYYFYLFGIGLGFQVLPLVEKYDPEMVVIAESDLEMIYHSCFVFDWRGFHDFMHERGKKIRLCFEQDPSSLLSKLGGIIQGECLLGLDGVMSFRQSNASTINIVYNEFNSTKTANLASFIGYTVDEYNMMKNSFRNLKSGDKRILRTVEKKLTEAPALIVGSGPSLEDNIEFVKKIQDKVILISSGSSISVLLKNGIRPDFHTVIERAKAVYDRHEEAAAEFDMSGIRLVTTTTIWPGIDKLFDETVYFFRPALSPLAIFCQVNSEILQGEGPQVTNTSFAFARRLGFKEIYMLGVDLGAVDPMRPRAEKAWISPGVPQRKLNIPTRGNLGRTVFTDRGLIQQRVTIENQIRTMKNVDVYNLSDGVRIEGAKPRRLADVKLGKIESEKLTLVKRTMDQFPIYTRDKFIGAWAGGGVRESVAEMVNQLVRALENAKTWDNKLIKQLDDINQYIGKVVRKQYAPRLLRGSVLRMCMYVNSVMLRLEDRDREDEVFEILREQVISMLREMEFEAYALADECESEDEHFAVKYA